jgi:hypothetical protein
MEETETLYDPDAYNDDLPYWVQVAGKPRLIVPYALDTNDFKFALSPGWMSGEDVRPTASRGRAGAQDDVDWPARTPDRPGAPMRWPASWTTSSGTRRYGCAAGSRSRGIGCRRTQTPAADDERRADSFPAGGLLPANNERGPKSNSSATRSLSLCFPSQKASAFSALPRSVWSSRKANASSPCRFRLYHQLMCALVSICPVGFRAQFQTMRHRAFAIRSSGFRYRKLNSRLHASRISLLWRRLEGGTIKRFFRAHASDKCLIVRIRNAFMIWIN